MIARRLSECSRGTMAFTLSQLFLGAITIGMATFRGTEAYVSFHYETLVSHADYAASREGADHARAANAIANDNVISASVMGPRFAVEADNITMDAVAGIACPQAGPKNTHMRQICDDYHANKWRALAKLAWVRAEQETIWRSLGKLSSDLDRVTSLRGMGQVAATVASIDPAVHIRVVDPSIGQTPWGADNTSVACSLARTDAAGSGMPGSAFPALMENLLQGLPATLVGALPGPICGADIGGKPIQLGAVPSVAKKTQDDCASFSSHPSAPGAAAFYDCTTKHGKSGPLTQCTFDGGKCMNDRLEANSADFLRGLGLPAVASESNLGGATHAPSDDDWNRSPAFRVCALASKPVSSTIANIADAAHSIMSFGAPSSTVLRIPREYQACARWYFPDGGDSPFARVPHSQQPFVAGWKFALADEPGR